MWNRSRSDIHPIIRCCTRNFYRPRIPVIVDPGDILQEKESHQPMISWHRGRGKGTYRVVVYEPKFVFETVHGVTPGVELVTIGVWDRYHRQHSNESGRFAWATHWLWKSQTWLVGKRWTIKRVAQFHSLNLMFGKQNNPPPRIPVQFSDRRIWNNEILGGVEPLVTRIGRRPLPKLGNRTQTTFDCGLENIDFRSRPIHDMPSSWDVPRQGRCNMRTVDQEDTKSLPS